MTYKLTVHDSAEQAFETLAGLRSVVDQLVEYDSPTGRRPTLVWTAAQQGAWQRMRTEYESGATTLGARFYGVLRNNARTKPYGDTGLWATILFQVTGEAVWAEKAWSVLTAGFFARTEWDDNRVREYSAEYVLIYDWLYPWMSEPQRVQYRAALDVMFTQALSSPSLPASAPIRTTDSDQMIGVYAGVVFYALAAPLHEPAQQFYIRPFIGGTVATARDRSTMRNALSDYLEMADGGEWIESAEYNVGSMKLLALLAAGLKTTKLLGDFPDLSRFLLDACHRATYMLTPDLAKPVQWGDCQNPRVFEKAKWITHAMMFNDPVSRDLVYRIFEKFDTAAEPLARGFLFFDPYGERQPSSTLDAAWFADGQGVLVSRTGWDEDASLFFAHFPQRHPNGFVDHVVNYLGDVQLYRRKAWALTHPIAYGGYPNGGVGTNTMLHAGLGAPKEFRGAVHCSSGPGFEHVVGTVGGQVVNEQYYQPPPPYWYEWTRHVLWLPSDDGSADTIVFCDRSHAVSPMSLPKFTRYSAADQAKLSAEPLKQWLLHMPVAPKPDVGGFIWPGAKLTTLLPLVSQFTIVDEATWPPMEATVAAERKWHLRIRPAVEQPFDMFLNVLWLGDVGGCSCERVYGADWEGALVHRPNHRDVLAVFNAVPGPVLPGSIVSNTYNPAVPGILNAVRLRASGYDVSWTAKTSNTLVLLMDLGVGVRSEIVDGAGPHWKIWERES